MLTLCFVEDDEALRSTLGMVFGSMENTQYVMASSLGELQAQPVPFEALAVAVLDINLGANQPDGLQIFQWLKENGFKGRVIFISGHAKSHPKVVEACKLEGATFLQKPIKLTEFEDAVRGT